MSDRKQHEDRKQQERTRPNASAQNRGGSYAARGVPPLAPFYLQYVQDLSSLEVLDKLTPDLRYELERRIDLIKKLAPEKSQYIQFIVDTAVIELAHFVTNVIPAVLDQGTIEKLRKEVSNDCKKTFAFLRDCANSAQAQAAPSKLADQLLGATAAEPANLLKGDSSGGTSQEASGDKSLPKMFSGIAALQRECNHEGCASEACPIPPGEEFKLANSGLKESDTFNFSTMASEIRKLQVQYHYLKSHSVQTMDIEEIRRLGHDDVQSSEQTASSSGAAGASAADAARDDYIPRGFWFEDESAKGSLSYTYQEAIPIFEYLVQQNPKEVNNQVMLKLFLRLATNRPPSIACAMYIIDDDHKADKKDICLLATAISLIYPKSELPMLLDDLVPEKSCFRHKVSKTIILRAGRSLQEKVCALKAAHLVAVEMWFMERNSCDVVRRLTEAGKVTLRLALWLGHDRLVSFPGHGYLCSRCDITRDSGHARAWPGSQKKIFEFQMPPGMDPYLRDQLYIGLTPKKNSSYF